MNGKFVRRAVSCLLAVLSVVACRAEAQDAAKKEWTYDTFVAPRPRPAWLNNVALICESPFTGPDRKTVKPFVQKLIDAGFTVANMYPGGYFPLFEPKPGEQAPYSGEYRAEVEAMHKAGMKALAGTYPTIGEAFGPRDLIQQHPEYWLRNPLRSDTPRTACLLSGYGDAVIDLLVHYLKKYDLDGYQFDGWYQFGYCACDACRKRYKADTGLDIPPRQDTRDPAYLRYLAWRDQKLFELTIKLEKAIKAAKPSAAIVIWNVHDIAFNYPSYMPEQLDCVTDWVNKEWWDAYNVESVWLMKRLRGASGDRPPGIQPYMFMRQGLDIQSNVYHGSSCPIEEVLYRAHKAMAMGSFPIIWPGARQGWTESDSLRVGQDLVDFMPYVNQTKTLKYAACIDSDTTLQMSKTASKEGGAASMQDTDERIGYNRAGIARALLEDQIPFDVLSEHNLNPKTLALYKVVILPNNFCMSDRIARLLRDYVAGGGGLVATFETSLYDGWGNRRSDFALADLFGASWQASEPNTACRIGFSAARHPVTDDATMKTLMGTTGNTTYYGRFARVKPSATAVAPLTGIDAAHEKDAAKKEWTPLLLSEHGTGRVAYFPAAMDAAYYDAGYPYERMLLANAVRWAAKSDPTVKVTAPKCVQAGFFTKAVGGVRQEIVHLLNDIDSTTGHGSANEKQFAIREEVVPIAGVKVAFAGPKPQRVYLVPGKTALEPQQTPRGWEVSVPELDLHAVVVAEYSP